MQNPLEKHRCEALLQLITGLAVTHWSAQAYTSLQKPPHAAQSVAASLYPSQSLRRRQELHNITELQKALAAQDPAMRHKAQSGDTASHGPIDVLGFGDAVLQPGSAQNTATSPGDNRLAPERCQELSPAERCTGCQHWGAPSYPTWGSLPVPPQPRHVLEIEELSCDSPAGVERSAPHSPFPIPIFAVSEDEVKAGGCIPRFLPSKAISLNPEPLHKQGAQKSPKEGLQSHMGLCWTGQEPLPCPAAFLKQLSLKIIQEKLKHLISRGFERS